MDNIHSFDVACFIDGLRAGEIYNLGGGRANSCSILEAFDLASAVSGRSMKFEYVDAPRRGGHVRYISNLSNMRVYCPGWGITKSLWDILADTHSSGEQWSQPSC